MWLQIVFSLAVLLLLCTKLKESVANSPDTNFCQEYDIAGPLDARFGTTCNDGEICAIDPKTGYAQGCVPTSQCPGGANSRKITCDSSLCCCRSLETDHKKGVVDCNDVLNKDADSQWKEACAIPALQNLDICKINPTIEIFCARGPNKKDIEKCRGPKHHYCGIDQNSGKLKGCVHASECPGNVKGLPVACDPSKPSCCCQSPVGSGNLACNNYLNSEDTSIRDQACSLPELKHLDVCKESTTKLASTTEDPNQETTEDSQKPPSPSEPGVVKPKPDTPDEQKMGNRSKAGVIIAGVCVVLILLGCGVGIYLCLNKRKQPVAMIYSQPQVGYYGQQMPMAAHPSQQQNINAYPNPVQPAMPSRGGT